MVERLAPDVKQSCSKKWTTLPTSGFPYSLFLNNTMAHQISEKTDFISRCKEGTTVQECNWFNW